MYTQEQAEYAINTYVDSDKDNSKIAFIAAHLGKTPKSVIGKLSREGIYQKQIYVSKTGEAPITKKELVHMLAIKLEIEVNSIAGLEKAPKLDLKRLVEAI